MHNANRRRVTALRAGALIAQAALLAACGHRSVEIIEGCEDRAAPSCACQGAVVAPVCVGTAWHCPPCNSTLPPSPDAMPAARDAGPASDAAPALDASPPFDTRSTLDASADHAGSDTRDGCGDGSALICRRGCGHRTHEWRPVCEGTTWQCAWGGTLEDRSTPFPTCTDAG